MTLEEAIRILKQHNETGKSVMRLTGGRHLEHDLLAQVLDAYTRILKDNDSMRTLLKKADTDFSIIGELRNARMDPISSETVEYCDIINVAKKWRYHHIAKEFFNEPDYQGSPDSEEDKL